MFDIDLLDEFTRSYMETALWSSNDESDPETGGDPLDANYDITDIAPESVEKMIADCKKFQEQADIASIEDAPTGADGDSAYGMAGHDFWLNRNGHGAGFWDGDWPEPHGDRLNNLSKEFGECNLYVGDDNKIYIM